MQQGIDRLFAGCLAQRVVSLVQKADRANGFLLIVENRIYITAAVRSAPRLPWPDVRKAPVKRQDRHAHTFALQLVRIQIAL
jgi:hypothetical protein